MADGKVVIQTELDTSGAKKDMQSLGNTLGTAFKKTGGAVATAAGVSIAALGATVAATTATVINGAKEAAVYGDNVDKMSQKVGLSAEAFQEWDYVIAQNGGSIDGLAIGMKTLSNAVDSGSDAFERLGFAQEQVASLSQEELFEQTVAALQEMEAGTERSAIANDLFGRSAVDLAPLLNQSAAATEELKDQAREYGLVMSNEAVLASVAFGDSLDLMNKTLTAAKNGIAAEFLPTLTLVTDGLGKIFAGNMEGMGLVASGIRQSVDKVIELLPYVLDVGTQVITTLISGVAGNIPQIIEMGLTIISSLISAIITSLPLLGDGALSILNSLVDAVITLAPMLLDAAIQLLVQLAYGLSDMAPTLIPAAVELLNVLVRTLLDNLPLLMDAALALIVALIQGISEAMPLLIEYYPEIVLQFYKAIFENLPLIAESGWLIIKALLEGVGNSIIAIGKKIKEVIDFFVQRFKDSKETYKTIGSSIVEGLWAGIEASWNWLLDKVTGLVAGLVSTVKDVLDINSPSKVFKWIGEMTGDGMSLGFEDADPMDAIRSSIKAGIGNIQTNVSAMNLGRLSTTQSGLSNVSGSNYSGNIVFKIGETEVARTLLQPLLSEMNRQNYNVEVLGA